MIDVQNQLWVCGTNQLGQLGQNDHINRSSPVQIPGNWISCNATKATGASYMINSQNQLWCCGYNNYGQLGQNNTLKYSSPVQIPGSWSAISINSYTFVGIRLN